MTTPAQLTLEQLDEKIGDLREEIAKCQAQSTKIRFDSAQLLLNKLVGELSALADHGILEEFLGRNEDTALELKRTLEL